MDEQDSPPLAIRLAVRAILYSLGLLGLVAALSDQKTRHHVKRKRVLFLGQRSHKLDNFTGRLHHAPKLYFG